MRSPRWAFIAAIATLAALAPLTTRADHDPGLPDDAVPVNDALDRCHGVAGHASRTLSTPGVEFPTGATPILRFVQLSDSHIIDDDGPDVANGTPTELVLDPVAGEGSATFLNEELTDEVLNAMIATINECDGLAPLALTITTGDITDTNWLNVTRRVIDNLEGTANQDTAFEANCGYTTVDANGQPKLDGALDCPIPADLLAIPTGKVVADHPDQSELTNDTLGPDVEHDPTYRLNTTRALRQGLESAATAAANGSHTIAAGLPPALNCTTGEDGCVNEPLGIPYYAVFGNHDVSVKGTVTMQKPFGPPLTAYGRYFFESKREFINEWLHSDPATGFGFGFGENLHDTDDRNDGWYSTVAPTVEGHPGVRLITLDTTYDGVRAELHQHGETRELTEGLIAGNEVTDPRGLEQGWMSDEQGTWLADELAEAAAAGQPVLVFSHHPDRSFAERSYPVDAEVTAVALDQLLGKATHGDHPSTVIAHIAGHTHANRVNPCRPADCPIGAGAPDEAQIERAFWRFETASLINWPQEGRIVEVFELPDEGGYALRLTMISPDQNQAAAARSRVLAGYEAMCSVHEMMGGPLSSGPHDQARLETFLGNVAEQDFCPNQRGVTVAPGTPAGTARDRDVILLP